MENKLTEEDYLDWQLQMDLNIYGMSFEYMRDGKRERLDPTLVKVKRLKSGTTEWKSPIENFNSYYERREREL